MAIPCNTNFKATTLRRAWFRVRAGITQGVSLGPGPATMEVGCRLKIVVAEAWLVPCWPHGRCGVESMFWVQHGCSHCWLKRKIYSQGCPTPQETCTLGLWPGCWTVVICNEDAVGELVLAAPHIPRAPGEELLDGVCRDFP